MRRSTERKLRKALDDLWDYGGPLITGVVWFGAVILLAAVASMCRG